MTKVAPAQPLDKTAPPSTRSSKLSPPSPTSGKPNGFGEPDYLRRVITADLPAFQELYDERLATLPASNASAPPSSWRASMGRDSAGIPQEIR